MYGRHSVAAPPGESVLRKNSTWRKEGRARRPARTLVFRLELKPGTLFLYAALVALLQSRGCSGHLNAIFISFSTWFPGACLPG